MKTGEPVGIDGFDFVISCAESTTCIVQKQGCKELASQVTRHFFHYMGSFDYHLDVDS
jgi:hypothetical protein